MTGPDLRQLRTLLGWTQKRLAQELGVRTNTVSRWEQGVHPVSKPMVKLLRMLRKIRTP